MKLCQQCSNQYPNDKEFCPTCSHFPAVINGFEAYAPEVAHASVGFPPDAFALLAKAEAENFWFKARNNLLLWILTKYSPNPASFLEIGCGTGFVLSGVARQFTRTKIYGSEISVEGLPFAKTRVPNAHLMQMDAREIPFADNFDVIGAFDVLEHIEDDELVIKQVYNALAHEGLFILTVPQHMWLWSAIDELACHVRRYEAEDIHAKLTRAGFKIVHSTSFVSLLLPAMYAARRKNRTPGNDNNGMNELHLPGFLNRILYHIMKVEITLIKCGICFPFGGSRLVVAKKQ